MKINNNAKAEHCASAKALSIPISTKHGVEISNYLRYKNTSFAKDFLQNVIELKKPVPFKRFKRDVGHKAGMAAGRYPQKAAKEFLHLVESVEANAQAKGLNLSNLKIVKVLANKASIPFTGGRRRVGTKRTHLELVVQESAGKDKSKVGKVVAKEKKKVGKEQEVQPKKIEKEETVATKENVSVEKVIEKKEVETKEEKLKETKEPEIKKEVSTKVAPIKELVKESIKEEEKTGKENIESGEKEIENQVEEKEGPLKKEKNGLKDDHKEIIPEAREEQKENITNEISDAEVKVAETLPKEVDRSPAELLKRAQKKAAELNKQELRKQDVDEVSDLYQKLTKEGTLRDKDKNTKVNKGAGL